MAETNNILEVKNLSIQFGGLRAVDGLNMTIRRGQLYGLIGPNGAGKTTVFNMLTGVYKPTEGEFWLDGTRMNGKKTYQVVRAGDSYQQGWYRKNLPEYPTVQEHERSRQRKGGTS